MASSKPFGLYAPKNNLPGRRFPPCYPLHPSPLVDPIRGNNKS